MKQIAIALLPLLFSCATLRQMGEATNTGGPTEADRRAQVDDNLGTFVGHPVAGMIKEWGMPQATMKLADGSDVYEYVVNRQAGTEHTRMLFGGVRSVAYERDCRVTFVANSAGNVVSFHYEGANCL